MHVTLHALHGTMAGRLAGQSAGAGEAPCKGGEGRGEAGASRPLRSSSDAGLDNVVEPVAHPRRQTRPHDEARIKLDDDAYSEGLMWPWRNWCGSGRPRRRGGRGVGGRERPKVVVVWRGRKEPRLDLVGRLELA